MKRKTVLEKKTEAVGEDGCAKVTQYCSVSIHPSGDTGVDKWWYFTEKAAQGAWCPNDSIRMLAPRKTQKVLERQIDPPPTSEVRNTAILALTHKAFDALGPLRVEPDCQGCDWMMDYYNTMGPTKLAHTCYVEWVSDERYAEARAAATPYATAALMHAMVDRMTCGQKMPMNTVIPSEAEEEVIKQRLIVIERSTMEKVEWDPEEHALWSLARSTLGFLEQVSVTTPRDNGEPPLKRHTTLEVTNGEPVRCTTTSKPPTLTLDGLLDMNTKESSDECEVGDGVDPIEPLRTEDVVGKGCFSWIRRTREALGDRGIADGQEEREEDIVDLPREALADYGEAGDPTAREEDVVDNPYQHLRYQGLPTFGLNTDTPGAPEKY